MLLSRPQKELLDILRQYGAVREDQAKKLLEQHYVDLRFNTIVHQMICGGLVRRENDLLYDRGAYADPNIILAIDIMLLLEPKQIEVMQKGKAPFELTFFRQRKEKLWRYDICIVDSGKEAVVSAALENIYHKYRIIVFVLESPEQRTKLTATCEHCFVWKENGTYKFYK